MPCLGGEQGEQGAKTILQSVGMLEVGKAQGLVFFFWGGVYLKAGLGGLDLTKLRV